MISNFYLIDNPFKRTFVSDLDDFESQPFIPTKTLERLIIGIKMSLPTEDKKKAKISIDYRITNSFLGKKGIGKTSFLLYIQQFLQKLKNNFLVLYINKDYNKITDQPYWALYYFIFNQLPPSTTADIEKRVLNEIKNHPHTYFLFDVPENVADSKELSFLAKLWDFIIRNHLGSILVTFNQSHYDKLNEITNIIGESGKITTFNLQKDYNEDLMLQIAKERLQISRPNGYNGDKYFPFTFEALQLIAKQSNNTPRNFLTGCDLCLREAVNQQKKNIDLNFVQQTLQSSFASEIIENKTQNLEERKIFLQIYHSLKNNSFDKTTSNLQSIWRELHDKNIISFSYPTFVSRIKKLTEWEILRQCKNFKTPRGKSIELIA